MQGSIIQRDSDIGTRSCAAPPRKLIVAMHNNYEKMRFHDDNTDGTYNFNESLQKCVGGFQSRSRV